MLQSETSEGVGNLILTFIISVVYQHKYELITPRSPAGATQERLERAVLDYHRSIDLPLHSYVRRVSSVVLPTGQKLSQSHLLLRP
jgi:hypothetical protein